jgi:hypothetical protein
MLVEPVAFGSPIVWPAEFSRTSLTSSDTILVWATVAVDVTAMELSVGTELALNSKFCK